MPELPLPATHVRTAVARAARQVRRRTQLATVAAQAVSAALLLDAEGRGPPAAHAAQATQVLPANSSAAEHRIIGHPSKLIREGDRRAPPAERAPQQGWAGGGVESPASS
eukprot:scaffold227505_cov18-Tisochrysis_lutea.AAC.1